MQNPLQAACLTMKKFHFKKWSMKYIYYIKYKNIGGMNTVAELELEEIVDTIKNVCRSEKHIG